MAFTIDTKPSARSARLHIDGVFSAIEVEQLIADLTRARAMMQPAVPRDPEQTVDVHVEVQRSPRFFVNEAPHHAGVLLRLRDPGAGWRAFWLPYNEAGRLAALLDEWSRPRRS
jgi:hypothetical protein